MVKNNFEKEIKIKCLEEDTTQAEIAEKAGTTGSYVSRLINKNDGIINKTFVRLLEELGYDVELTYVKKPANKKSSPKQDLSEEKFTGSR